MEPSIMREFVRLAETQNFTRATEDLYIVQPVKHTETILLCFEGNHSVPATRSKSFRATRSKSFRATQS